MVSATVTRPTVTTEALTVERVSHVFSHRDVQALADVNLSLEEGSFVSLIGPSGCGKSTLLNIMAGLMEPTAGRVSLFGSPTHAPRREIGIMFQQATLLPWKSALENILLPIELRHGRKAARGHRDRAVALMKTAGLSGFEDALPNHLSGGMAQRVAICRMLIEDPPVLLLDEPFGALDELTREHMDLELYRISKSTEATVVLVTHSIAESVLLSDRVCVMSARPGRIHEIVDIDLPHPRGEWTLQLPEFGHHISKVRSLLDEHSQGGS